MEEAECREGVAAVKEEHLISGWEDGRGGWVCTVSEEFRRCHLGKLQGR